MPYIQKSKPPRLDHIYRLMDAKGMSAADLAAAADVSYNIVYRTLNGQTWINMESAIRLADCLGITLDDLMGRKKP